MKNDERAYNNKKFIPYSAYTNF